jgi:hypothetical protein
MPMKFYARVADVGPRAYSFICKVLDGRRGLIKPGGAEGDAIKAVGGLEELLIADGLDRG